MAKLLLAYKTIVIKVIFEMKYQNTNSDYGLISMLLHSIIAICIMLMLVIGVLFSFHLPREFFYISMSIHKSLGLTIIILMIIRVIWHLINPYPSNINKKKSLQFYLSKFTHNLFYMVIFSICLVGWIMSAAGGHKTYFWWLFNSTFPIKANEKISSLGSSLHLILAWLLFLLIIVHIMGVIYHQFIKKDNIISRMFYIH